MFDVGMFLKNSAYFSEKQGTTLFHEMENLLSLIERSMIPKCGECEFEKIFTI